MAIRQVRLEPLALSVSGRERMFNGWAAARGEKRMIFSVRIARFSALMATEQRIRFSCTLDDRGRELIDRNPQRADHCDDRDSMNAG